MPSRPRPSKITKHNGSARYRKTVSDTGQQQLDHQYIVEDGTANGNGALNNRVPLGPGQLALPVPQSGPLSSIGGGDGCDAFSFSNQPNPYPMPGPERYPSAAELAYSKYGAAVKLESALCKKVAGEEAKRLPMQRRPDQKLNIDRRSNMEAFLAHVTGQVADKPCKNCHKGHGPWAQCVVYDGQMCGSCTNCWYNASGSRCTFHGNGAATASTASPTSATLGGISADAPEETGGKNLPYYSSPKNELKPISDWATPRHDNESNASTQSQPHAPEHLPVQPPAYIDYHQPPPIPHGLPSLGMSFGSSHDVSAAAASWMANDPTRRLIYQAMGDVAMLSRRDRHIARIETAAEELAMRVAEYQEYMRTPEGMTEQQHYEENASTQMMPPGHAHDARMETMETESVHDGSPMS
ncbi:hypothetical protein V2A60_001468 [Cordyceps javanica]